VIVESGTHRPVNFEKLPKKTKFPEKFEFPDKRGFELTAKKKIKKSIPGPWPSTICKLIMMFRVWNISIGQLELAAWLCSFRAPAHLLIS